MHTPRRPIQCILCRQTVRAIALVSCARSPIYVLVYFCRAPQNRVEIFSIHPAGSALLCSFVFTRPSDVITFSTVD